MTYFVVAVHPQNYRPLPIMSGDDGNDERIALFESVKDAREMAKGQTLCVAGGYKIIEWPYRDMP